MILRFLFFFILFYLLYKLLVDFIIPVYKTTRKLKKGFKAMNEHMQQNASAQANSSNGSIPKKPAEKKGDYIDFEEVKE